MFSIEEVQKALSRMSNGKASGEDGIPIECLKIMGSEDIERLVISLNKIWVEGLLPKGWEKARIIPLFKDGEKSKAGNYRGISLLNSGYKILTNLLANRLNEWVEKEKKLKESQGGFRKKRGTRDLIFVLNSLINKRIPTKKGKLYVAFIDFQKAYDTINRELLLKKIWNIGIKGRFHAMIREIYTDTKAEILVGGRVTEEFTADVGVRQGWPLSSVLFDIFIDDVDDEWTRRGEGGTVIGKIKIRVLKFADDIAVLAENAQELTKMLKTLEKYVGKNGLTVNTDKTKIMIFRNEGKGKKWKFNGVELEIVKEFKYLGYWFSNKYSMEKQIATMAGKAQKATNATWGLIKRSGRDNRKDRIYLMESLARSVALYGVEVWGWGNLKSIVKVQGRYCKMALGVARNTPRYIWRREFGIRGIEYTVRDRAFRFVKDLLEMEDDRWPKICFMEEIRAILNKKPTKWGKAFSNVLEEIGCNEIVRSIWKRENEPAVVYNKLKSSLKIWWEKEEEKELRGIQNSTYNMLYKEILPGSKGAEYWDRKVNTKESKELWARIRCGNVGRAFKKGFKEWKCRLCFWEDETLSHLLCCSEASKLQTERTREFVLRWKGDRREDDLKDLLVETLKGEIKEEICEYNNVVERKIKEDILVCR